MDIVVTTPKNEIENAKREGEAVEAEGGYWFRTFRYKPKVGVGDKIFFVEDGEIRGYGTIIEVTQINGRLRCEITDRIWGKEGDWVVAYNDWRWLPEPIPFRGFQGIRYVERLPALRKELTKIVG